MRPVVAVEAPDATQRGRAAGSGLAQTADELGVLRPPVDARLLAGVDHQLLPQRQAGLVRIEHVTRLAPGPAVALADAHALERHERSLQQPIELRERRGDRVTRPDRDDHERNRGVAAEEPRAPPRAVRGAVDAQEDARARGAVAVEQVDDRDERGLPARPLLAAPAGGPLPRPR